LGQPHSVNEIRLVNEPAGTEQLADDRNRHTDFFAQDTWVLSDRLTLLLGIRFDRQETYYMDSALQPEQSDFFPTGVIPGRDVITWNMWAPRIGVTLDLSGTGKTVLKGHYGRYNNNAADIFYTVNPAGTAFQQFKFLDQNQNGIYDGQQELGPLVGQQGTVLGDDLEDIRGTAYNPNVDAAYVDEFGASLEHQLLDDTSLRFSYVRKQRKKMFYIWNRAQVLPLLEEGIPCGDEVFPCPPDPFTGEPITTLMRVPSRSAFAQDPIIDTFPDGMDRFDYDTVQVAFGRRFRGRFFLQGSFDYQWRNEPRNAAGDSRNPLTVDPIGAWFFQNHNPAVSNKQKNTSWGARFLARYVFPAEIAVSTNVRHQSGWPWSPIHRVNIPGSGTQPFFLENIENNRSDNVTIVDIRLDKSFRLSERVILTGLFDVYNLLNSNPETNFALRTGRSFGNIIAVLDPRVVKVGIRLQF
jgi:outer membrane receptor protein involved in Fe transport